MTLSETFRADLEWPSLEGAILDGGYELKRTLERTADDAVFRVRVLGGAGLELIAKFHRAGPSQSAAQLALWELLRELPHRNLSVPLAAGRKSVDGRETVYVLLAVPDDRLSAVVGERALTEEEAREVLRSTARALAHLHANGLAHGCVSPETILARGETIQLAGECVRKVNDAPPLEITKPRYLAPECDTFQVTEAADVWCLGATLFETLAQKPYPADPKEAKAVIAGLPLALLLRRCLVRDADKRATVAEVLAILEKGPSAALEIADEDEQEPEQEAEKEPEKAEHERPCPVPSDIATEEIPVEAAAAEVQPENEADGGVPLELGAVETGAHRDDLLDIPIIKAPLPPKQTTLNMADEKPVAEAVAPPEEPSASPPVAAPVPIEARHRPMKVKRQSVEARFRSLYGSEQDTDVPTATTFAPPSARERRGVRLKAGPGTWRGVVAGAAALLMVAAVVWQVIIPRLQTQAENAGPTRGASASARGNGSAWPTRTLPAGDGTLPDARRQPAPQESHADESGATATFPAPQGRPSEESGATATFPTSTWRVVLYSYEHQSDADRRVELVNHNHPGLRAHLFVAGNGGPYLVVTGDATSQDHALAVRKKALQLGIPHAHLQEFTQ
jgi:hypothetical protein